MARGWFLLVLLLSLPVSAQTSLSLQAGWNAVGFPVRQLTALRTSGELFAVTWDGSRYVDLPSFTTAAVNQLGTMRGLWVYSRDVGTLSYSGDPGTAGLELVAGWNLVSFPFPGAVRPSQLVVSVGGAPVPLGNYLLPQFTEVGAGPVDATRSETRLRGGQPYWVYASSPVTLAVLPPPPEPSPTLPPLPSPEPSPSPFALPGAGQHWRYHKVFAEEGIRTTLRGLAYADRRFLAVGVRDSKGFVASSVDGEAWTSAPALSTGLLDVCYGRGRWVAVGWTNFWTSTDGHTWLATQSRPDLYGYRVAYGNGRFVAIGTDQIHVSEDGLTWATRRAPDLGLVGPNFQGLAYGNGRFLVVGDQAYLSVDGLEWFRRPLPPTFRGDVYKIYNAVHFADGRFVASAPGSHLASSPDGEQWQTHAPPRFEGSGVVYSSAAFGNGRWAVPEDTSAVLTSPDLVADWQVVIRPQPRGFDVPPAYILALEYAEGRFVGVGNFGVYTSP